MRKKPKSFWLCVTAAVLSVGAFLISINYEYCWRGHPLAFYLAPGNLGVTWSAWPDEEAPSGFSMTHLPRPLFVWLPELHHDRYGTILVMPLWLLVVASIIGALILRRNAELSVVGSCGCGYDVTGNTSGVCPECGKRILISKG